MTEPYEVTYARLRASARRLGQLRALREDGIGSDFVLGVEKHIFAGLAQRLLDYDDVAPVDPGTIKSPESVA